MRAFLKWLQAEAVWVNRLLNMGEREDCERASLSRLAVIVTTASVLALWLAIEIFNTLIESI